jgi:hypothetical protein
LHVIFFFFLFGFVWFVLFCCWDSFYPPNLSDYGLNTSAVPQELVDAGVALVMTRHEDRWFYTGPNNLEINELKAAIQDTTNNWQGFSVDNGDGSGAPVVAGRGRIMASTAAAAAMAAAVSIIISALLVQ